MIVVALKIIIAQMELCLYQRQGGFLFYYVSEFPQWQLVPSSLNLFNEASKGHFYPKVKYDNLLNDDFFTNDPRGRGNFQRVSKMLYNLINYSYWAGVTEMAMKSGTSCGSTTAVKTTGRKMHMNRFWSNYILSTTSSRNFNWGK